MSGDAPPARVIVELCRVFLPKPTKNGDLFQRTADLVIEDGRVVLANHSDWEPVPYGEWNT